MTMEESWAGMAFNDIVTRLFGADGFKPDGMPHYQVSRFVTQLCAHTWHRWRKSYSTRRGYVKRARSAADQLYQSTQAPDYYHYYVC